MKRKPPLPFPTPRTPEYSNRRPDQCNLQYPQDCKKRNKFENVASGGNALTLPSSARFQNPLQNEMSASRVTCNLIQSPPLLLHLDDSFCALFRTDEKASGVDQRSQRAMPLLPGQGISRQHDADESEDARDRRGELKNPPIHQGEDFAM